ncbi:MAG: EamA family transporter, partial [Planctomycetota bacterium]
MSTPELKPITLLSAALALFCAALWGGVAVVVQFAKADIPPLGTAWLRFAVSVPFLAAWFKLTGHSLMPRRGELPAIAFVGIILFFQIATFHYGVSNTNSAHASLVIGMNPVMVAFTAHFALRGERLGPAMVGGLVLGGVGLAMVV